MFHLMTHAFFKALLFLAAGIVIHALVGEQDMRKMGGLRKYLPRTYWAFLIGALALTGIPPLSGFFSKDAILASALAAGTYGQILFVVGVIGAFLTGLYTFRMVFIVFGGEPSAYAREHMHRPERTEPWVWMAWTVAVLSLLAVVGGWVDIPGVWDPFGDFLEPTVEPLVEPSGTQEFWASLAAFALGLVRNRRRLGRVLGTEAPHPAGQRRAGGARAQVLLRRALRRGLLPADGAARALAARPLRGADRARLDHRNRVGRTPPCR